MPAVVAACIGFASAAAVAVIGLFDFALTIMLNKRSERKVELRKYRGKYSMKKTVRSFICNIVVLSACLCIGSGSVQAAEAQTNEAQVSETQTSEAQTNEAQTSIFAELPESFYFSSGVGAWWTGIDIAEDGTFSGQYMDSDMGDRGDGYPNGTVYICSFTGRFSQAEQVDDLTWSMKLESLEPEEDSGIVTYEDGVRYITSDPYGFDNADQFYIYLPGSVLDDLPEGFVSWTYAHFMDQDVIPEGYYGIYNEGGEEGFIGVKEETQEEQSETDGYQLDQ
jgi:hypothetical protein